MKIYRVNNDVNDYQSFYPVNDLIWNTGIFEIDCNSKKRDWKNIEFYILKPNLPKGNFFGAIPGCTIMDGLAMEKLLDFWESSGELIPFLYKNERFYIYNCLSCYDLLNDDETDWVFGKTTGEKIRINEYSFYENRITETSIFKIPQTMKIEILTTTELNDIENEFIYQVKKNNLTGLLFNEIWRSKS